MTTNSNTTLRSELTPEIVDTVVRDLSKQARKNPETTKADVEYWGKLISDAREGGEAVKESVLFEKMAHCDPNASLATHMSFIQLGFELGEYINRRRSERKAA